MNTFFDSLCNVFLNVDNTASRLEMQRILCDFLLKVSFDDYSVIFYLCTCMIYPNHDVRELNMGESQILKIIASLSGRSFKMIKSDYAIIGDLGTIASKYRMNTLFKIEKKYTVNEILDILREIASIEGKDSQQSRSKIILRTMIALSDNEKKYFVRLLEGNLKIGLALQMVLTSLGMALSVGKVERKKVKQKKDEFVEIQDPVNILKHAYDCCSDIEVLLQKIKNEGFESLMNMPIIPLQPFRPMLCLPLSSFNVPFQNFLCEIKYDGERVQIHKNQDEIILYSRNGECSSKKYPEIVDDVEKQRNNFVLDGEIVAYDDTEGKILPFQRLATRKTKNLNMNDVQVQVFIFDILWFNNECLLNKKLKERRIMMRRAFYETEILKYSEILSSTDDLKQKGKYQLSNLENDKSDGFDQEGEQDYENNHNKDEHDTEIKSESSSIDKSNKKLKKQKTNLTVLSEESIALVEKAFNQSLEESTEGLVIKSMESIYIPNKRSNYWLKLKKDYLTMADTLDLVVMGAFYGKGRRTGVYGAFLMGCLNNENIEAICKLGTGFGDEALNSFKKNFKISKTAPSNYKWKRGCAPDIWIEPEFIFEVNAANISSSSLYSTELSLRFPRFVRIRDDKKVADATQLEIIKKML